METLVVPSTGSGTSENSGNGTEDLVCPHLSRNFSPMSSPERDISALEDNFRGR
jgi:hypothetical protein